MVVRLRDLPEGVRRLMRERGSPVDRLVVNPDVYERLHKRRAGGRRAQRSGEGLEARVVMAAMAQVKLVSLTALPKSGARFHGKGKAHVVPICCDFAGCVVGPGTGIFFDAKRVGPEVGSLRIGDEKIVKRHQRIFLHAQATAGAIAGVLTEHAGVYRWLDGRHLVWAEGKVRAIKWEDPRWHVLGESIDFRRLLAAYGVNRETTVKHDGEAWR